MSAISTGLVTAVMLLTAADGSVAAQHGHYSCVLAGQGGCSDLCLGNRVSPIDKSIHLVADLDSKTVVLNGIPGTLVNAEGRLIVHWHLGIIDEVRLTVGRGSREYWVELSPAQGEGTTATFNCRLV